MMRLPVCRLALLGMLGLCAWGLAGCTSKPPQTQTEKPSLTVIAESPRQWTGVAAAADGRLFVNYPRWQQPVPFSVGVLQIDGQVRPYPDQDWNSWAPGRPVEARFVCVQSVVADKRGNLWILDSGNPQFKGVIPGAPKLVQVDLASNQSVRTYHFDALAAPTNSYLNDVRFDTSGDYAYLTDSGAGAILLLDLKTGIAQRRLAHDPSTKAQDITLTIGGRPFLRNGKPAKVNCDGIALDPSEHWLYFQALTSRTLYRVPTSALRDSSISEDHLARLVEKVGQTGAADGLEFGADGRLYLTGLEESAIKRLKPDGTTEIVVQDPRLAWPDSFAVGPHGELYVTTSQIHLGPQPPTPYRLFRVDGLGN